MSSRYNMIGVWQGKYSWISESSQRFHKAQKAFFQTDIGPLGPARQSRLYYQSAWEPDSSPWLNPVWWCIDFGLLAPARSQVGSRDTCQLWFEHSTFSNLHTFCILAPFAPRFASFPQWQSEQPIHFGSIMANFSNNSIHNFSHWSYNGFWGTGYRCSPFYEGDCILQQFDEADLWTAQKTFWGSPNTPLLVGQFMGQVNIFHSLSAGLCKVTPALFQLVFL